MTLREHLIGAWKLTYYAEHLGPDGPITYPHGEKPTGLSMYTPDGYMSAQIMTPDRPAYDNPTAAGGTENQRAMAAAGYLAYSGSYPVDELTGTIHHHVLVSLMPNWIGGTQLRHSRLAEHQLTLTAQSAAPGQSTSLLSTLHWTKTGQESARVAHEQHSPLSLDPAATPPRGHAITTIQGPSRRF